MICDICNQLIIGEYYEDKWGTKTHFEHDGCETTRCYCCYKYVDHTDQKKALIYGDGRVICRICHNNAVNTIEKGREAKQICLNLFRKAGIPLPEERITLVINDKTYAKETLGRESFHGLMSTKSKSTLAGFVNEYIINIINGLHKITFCGVLVHELMHIFIKENKFKMSVIEEEGLCELLCYYFYEQSKTQIGSILMSLMEESIDPIYGDGFRIMKNKIDNFGSWRKLINSFNSD